MWGQHHSKSDIDKFECYIFDSRSFLLGNRHDGGHHSEVENEGIKIEKDTYEIGHVVRQLLKGNINFLWGVMSPKFDLVTTNIDPNMWELRRITRKSFSKATTHSIRGFAIHNLKHWFGLIVKRISSIDGSTLFLIVGKKKQKLYPDDKKYQKIINTCARTVDFGIKLLNEGVLDFDNPRGAKKPQDIIDLLNELETAYNFSKLPEKPDLKPFEEFLLYTRLNNLRKNR